MTLLLYGFLATMSADGKDKGQGKGKHAVGGSSATVLNVSYGAHPVSLPPGLQKTLASGKPLLPGWQKKLRPFPSYLEIRLCPPCGYCGRGVIDGCGVIYNKKAAILLDIV